MMKGSCLCGSIQFTVESDPDAKIICYCSDCRKGSGHLGQILGKYQSKDVEILDLNSSLKEYTVEKTQSGFPKKKVFCGDCGCTIFTQPMKYKGAIIMLRTTLIEGSFSKFAPTKAIFVEEKESFLEGTPNKYY